MSEDAGEKTEPATPERRRKAREEGQFPRARDAGATVGSVGVLIALASMAPSMSRELRALAHRAYDDLPALSRADPQVLAELVLPPLVTLTAPAIVAALVLAFAVGVAEAGYEPRLELAAPKWSRLDPIARLGSMFSPREMAGNVGILLLKVIAVSVVVAEILEDELPLLTRLARAPLPAAATAVASSVYRLALWASLTLVVIGVLDYLQNWFSHEKRIRMSRQELKEEFKQQEGDPQVKGKQRARAREAARRGLAKALRASDVVVANPTHFSVALRYRAEEGAPVVTAKGVDEVALFIRELAKTHNVPVVENIPLARALHARVKVGRTVPADLYRAVAEVLAFVYRIRGKGRSLSA
ncbi:MAG: EscU/YscU/HrcU family type III secretion system export apparatus switch protein [Deltaproteobacteria bacterium]|nr:EscU/YscU/HrcU family type III secretion system export apparatus switch protein [Deltaproteobacteria bacterium]